MTGDLVLRSRLHERLDAGLETPLTVVSAPAGYGKSTLVSQWLESLDHPSAWVSLDETDSELVVFLGYLLAAVGAVFPGACQGTAVLLRAPVLPPVPVVALSLANELDALDTPFVLILDDYHRITQASGVQTLLGILLQHPPRPLHLLVISRRDPPLALSALRAGSRLTEVRPQDLRFTGPETARLLTGATGVTVGEDALVNLEHELEGWAAGLRLVSLSLRGVEDPDAFLKQLRDGVAHTQEYLLREVLARQSPEARSCLLRSSILERFCVGVLAAVVPRGDGAEPGRSARAFVEGLRRSDLFTIPLDAQGEWFRHHHLFRELLHAQLRQESEPKEIASLHSRASQWFEAQGFVEEAVTHAVAVDPQAAVRLVERHRYEAMDSEQWPRLERWIGLLPTDACERSPILTSARAFVLESRSDYMGFVAQRDRAEALLAGLPPDAPEAEVVRGEIGVLKGEEAIFAGQNDRAIECADQAAELVPREALHVGSYIVGERALGLQGMGDLERGLESIDAAWNGAVGARSGFFRARLSTWRCMVHMMEGTLAAVRPAAVQCLQLGRSLRLPESRGFGRYFLGIAHYLWDELTEAERHLTALLTERHTCRPQYCGQGSLVLALIHTRFGRTGAAADVMQALVEQVADNRLSLSPERVRAFEAELALRQGRLEEARVLAAGADLASPPPLWFFFVPQLVPVKLLLARGAAEDLDEALERLAELDEFLRAAHRNTNRIDVLCLQALVHDARGEEVVALQRLTEAVSLGALGGNVRSFADLGPPMAGLLGKLAGGRDDAAYVERILSAFGEAEERPADPVGPRPVSQPPVDALTNRQLDVLGLLARRLGDKEIAAKLCISPETVNSHLKRVYEKLEVRGRRQAVARAKELGLLKAL